MKLRGQLAGLRRDDIEWERGQQALAKALAAWRAEPIVAPVLTALKRFGAGAALENCKALAALFSASGNAADRRAQAFASSLVAAGLSGLDGHPLGQLPLRHGARDAAPMLVLAQAGGATLALAAYDGDVLATLPAPRTVRFRPCESWKRVLSGSGSAAAVRYEPGEPPNLIAGTLPLRTGDVHYSFGPCESLDVRGVDGVLVVLRLERELGDRGPVREYSLADGALVHQASARQDESRNELIVALLGQMQRIDAVPQMARVALGGGGEANRGSDSDSLRWQALREVIALDALGGVELLAHVAADPEDTLKGSARALLESLLRSRPDLQGAGTWPV